MNHNRNSQLAVVISLSLALSIGLAIFISTSKSGTHSFLFPSFSLFDKNKTKERKRNDEEDCEEDEEEANSSSEVSNEHSQHVLQCADKLLRFLEPLHFNHLKLHVNEIESIHISSLSATHMEVFDASSIRRVILHDESIEKSNSLLMHHLQDIETEGVVGFDTEFLSYANEAFDKEVNNENDISVIQLSIFSSKSSAVYSHIIHLSKLSSESGEVPQLVRQILENPRILKVGVGLTEDMKRLRIGYSIKLKGVVDLQRQQREWKAQSLKKLALMILGHELQYKDKRITKSNWSCEKLSIEQIHYAALDSMVPLQIYYKLSLQSFSWTVFHFNVNHHQNGSDNNSNGNKRKKEDLSSSTSKQQQQRSKRSLEKSYKPRKQPLYENVSLLAPDGRRLSFISHKKLAWYISRDFVEVTTDNENQIVNAKLKFEPKGKSKLDDLYYQSEKENLCVSCGSIDGLIRHSLVPHEFRSHFPLHLKTHSSHDVVLLCVKCKALIITAAEKLRQELIEKYSNIPKETLLKSNMVVLEPVRNAKRAAKALIEFDKKLPKERKNELIAVIKKFLGLDDDAEVPISELKRVLEMKDTEVAQNYVSPVEIAVKAIEKRENGLQELVEIWREMFINVLQPQFMPIGWSVKRKLDIAQIN